MYKTILEYVAWAPESENPKMFQNSKILSVNNDATNGKFCV